MCEAMDYFTPEEIEQIQAAKRAAMEKTREVVRSRGVKLHPRLVGTIHDNGV